MKQYISPALQVNETEVCHMLAESLVTKETPVDDSPALSKEDNSWDIWGN